MLGIRLWQPEVSFGDGLHQIGGATRLWPLAAYPDWLAVVCRAMPFTALIEYARTSDPAAASFAGALGVETLVTVIWGGIGVGAAAWALRRNQRSPQPGL